MERLGDLTVALLALDEAEPGKRGGGVPRSWEQGFSRQRHLGSSGSKAFPERQRKTFNPLVSTAEQRVASEAGRAPAHWRPWSHFPGNREDPGHTGHSDSPASVQTILGIYPSFRAGWGSGESGSARGGVAEGVTSILSRTRSMYHSTAGAVTTSPGWTRHSCPSTQLLGVPLCSTLGVVHHSHPVVPIRHLSWHIQQHHAEVLGS